MGEDGDKCVEVEEDWERSGMSGRVWRRLGEDGDERERRGMSGRELG